MQAQQKAPRDIAADLDGIETEVEGWGMSTHSGSVVVKPRDLDSVKDVFAYARKHGIPVGFRGSGCSYGDASQNAGGILMDLSDFAKIHSINSETGILVGDPGVTIEQIWRQSIRLGYWPPVVSGTMYPTLGGLLSMNVHGKNNWKSGTISEHVLSFRFLTIEGELLECSREKNSELFHAAIGGFGMLGCFVEVTLKLKKIHSGYLDVHAIATPTLRDMICWFEEHKDSYDYLVGWVDCFPKGRRLGRGLIHAANYLKEGEDPNPLAGFSPIAQDLPERLFGIVPKGIMWVGLRPFINDVGMRLINSAKYLSGVKGQTRGTPHRQAHAEFAFLLDYVPNWKLAYKPGGLIQYQSFLPKESAGRVHPQLIEMCHESGLYPYLGVYKRHREDPFLMTHAVDGFSFAMDFKVTAFNRQKLWDLTRRMDEVVVNAGGRLYFAKDATTTEKTVRRIWCDGQIDQLAKLKKELDPHGLLQTNLARRLFPYFFASEGGPSENAD